MTRTSVALCAAALCFLAVLGSAAGRAQSSTTGATPGYVWNLPRGFPQPKVPSDNPMTAEKVELGRHLFYDTRLSKDGTFSCATCHQQARAFTDARPHVTGVTGEVHRRSAMSLANVAYNPVLTWADPGMQQLEQQLLVPMFGLRPVEMGMGGQESQLLDRLRAEPKYTALFRAAFPDDSARVSVINVARAIASFERTLLSGSAPYDRYRTQMALDAIPPAAKRGEELFFDDRASCYRCHGGFNFAQTVTFVGKPFVEIEFHNTGLYNVDGKGAYPAEDRGIYEVSGNPADMGRFRAPTLRNIAITGPYMHDGSIATLDEVLRHYEAGGRTIASGPHQGIGARSPLKSSFVKGFTLTDDERRDMVAFLESLTDTAFTTDPRFANPWIPH